MTAEEHTNDWEAMKPDTFSLKELTTYIVNDYNEVFPVGAIVSHDVETGKWELYDPKKHDTWWGQVMDRKENHAIISIATRYY